MEDDDEDGDEALTTLQSQGQNPGPPKEPCILNPSRH